MKNTKGQIATEFVLVLPWLCAALLIFVMFIIFCARAQLAVYAGYMAGRVYGVWPETIPQGNQGREDMVRNELEGLLPKSDIEFKNVGNELEVTSKITAPLRFGILNEWNFITRVPVVIEPMYACVGEDNALPTAVQEDCL